MLKRTALIAGLVLLTGCSGQRGSLAPKKSSSVGSPAAEQPLNINAAEEEDIEIPLPKECQALLDQSKAWQYKIDQPWKPSSRDQALEVLSFLASLSLVPEDSAKTFLAFTQRSLPNTEAEAEKNILDFQKAQVCHPSVVITLIQGLFEYHWPESDKKLLATHWRGFLENLENRDAPILIRALELQVIEQAMLKKILTARDKTAARILAKAQREIQEAEAGLQEKEQSANPILLESLLRDDLNQSREIRVRTQKILSLLK